MLMRYRVPIAIAFILVSGFLTLGQDRSPEFTHYPARVVRTRKSVRVQIHSTPDTSCFRTMLRRTVRRGSTFAGHYALDYWGCGTNCARISIVDLLTGRAYVSPFYVGIAGGDGNPIKVKPESRLVLVNDPEMVTKEYGDPPPEEHAPRYYLWTGRHLLPINNGKVERREPKREFNRCSEIERF